MPIKNRQIEGRNPVLEALRAGNEIFNIVVEEGLKSDDRVREILELARKQQIPIIKKGWKNINRISITQVHQGVIAFGKPLPTYSLAWVLENCRKKNKDPLIVVIPKVLYDHNLGAIIRTCEGAGIDCLMINNRNSLNTAVSRGSMGAVEYLTVVQENIYSGLNLLKKNGIKIVAAEEEAQVPYYQAQLSGPLAIIIGSEDEGLSQNLAGRIDQLIKIPMLGKIGSLNMSVAAGIVIYEALRQRINSS